MKCYFCQNIIGTETNVWYKSCKFCKEQYKDSGLCNAYTRDHGFRLEWFYKGERYLFAFDLERQVGMVWLLPPYGGSKAIIRLHKVPSLNIARLLKKIQLYITFS